MRTFGYFTIALFLVTNLAHADPLVISDHDVIANFQRSHAGLKIVVQGYFKEVSNLGPGYAWRVVGKPDGAFTHIEGNSVVFNVLNALVDDGLATKKQDPASPGETVYAVTDKGERFLETPAYVASIPAKISDISIVRKDAKQGVFEHFSVVYIKYHFDADPLYFKLEEIIHGISFRNPNFKAVLLFKYNDFDKIWKAVALDAAPLNTDFKTHRVQDVLFSTPGLK